MFSAAHSAHTFPCAFSLTQFRTSAAHRARSKPTARAAEAATDPVAIPTTRHQAVAKHNGNPREVLHVVSSPMPEIGDDEVLVQLKFLGVNAGHDTFSCRGEHVGKANLGKKDFPIGAEGCGVVVATGANVTAVRPGDAVACTGPKYSDYSVLKEALTYKIPEPSAEAAALALSGVFGYTVIHHAADVKPGQTVFVTAGAGAAGSFIVQFARMAGARVLASVGSADKAAAATALGAQPINYHDTDVGAAVAAECPEGLDWVVDGVGGALQDSLIPRMKAGATMIQIGYISEYPHTGTEPMAWEGRPRNDEVMWGSDPVDLGQGRTLHSTVWPKDRSKLFEYRRRVFDMHAAAEVNALVDSKQFHGLESVPDAIDHMLAGGTIGKVVIRL